MLGAPFKQTEVFRDSKQRSVIRMGGFSEYQLTALVDWSKED